MIPAFLLVLFGALLLGACGATPKIPEETTVTDSGEVVDALAIAPPPPPGPSPPPPQVRLDTSFGSAGSLGGDLKAWNPVAVAMDMQGRILLAGPGPGSQPIPQKTTEIVHRLRPFRSG